MKKYIERKEIPKLANKLKSEFAPLHRLVIDAFIYSINNNIPSADVVEVVKCKDCQHSKFIKSCSKYMCDKRNEGRGELKYSNDFCSDGRRKTK